MSLYCSHELLALFRQDFQKNFSVTILLSLWKLMTPGHGSQGLDWQDFCMGPQEINTTKNKSCGSPDFEIGCKSMGVIGCHDNHCLGQNITKTHCSLSLCLMMPHFKFEYHWPTGYRNILL